MSSIGVRGSSAALLFALAACSSTSDAPPASSAPPPQSLAAALDAARSETGAPGAAAAIFRDGALVFAGASGEAARSPSRPLQAASLLPLVGVTEMATAVMVMWLEEQGRLRLDDKLARYVPYVPEADAITVAMLLAHRAGLPDYNGLTFDEIYFSLLDPAHSWTRDEILRAIDPDEQVFPPGQMYRYSQTEYIALGVVLEKASGRKADAFFDDLIAGPLGLDRCTLHRDPALAPDVAQGFAPDSGGTRTTIFPPDGSVPTHLWGTVWTDNGIMCTAADAARFTDALFGGRLVSQESLDRMTDFGSGGYYGMGIARKSDAAVPVFGHAGSRPGYGAAAWYDPGRRLTIVALVNSDGPAFLAGTVYDRLEQAYSSGAR